MEILHRRFAGDKDAPGLFLFEGLKGSGKSHLLLMAYHLFVSRAAAQRWLGQHSVQCELPSDAVVVINKFTDLPLFSIWDFVFERLTGKRPAQTGLPPSLAEVQSTLGDRFLVLILDELEQGIRVISDPAVRAQNIAFLQMLSEWANRESRVTLFPSIYSDQEEPGSTLKRVPSCRVRFEHASDKARVVLHRLFEDYLSLRPESARPVIESYLAAWRRHGGLRSEEFTSRLADSFPFSPDVLEILLDRVPARGGFQNVRGALGFLARMVKLTHGKTDLITPAHADISDQEVAVRLADLDPTGDLIRRARENLKDLASYPLVDGLGSTAMLYTLSGSGRDRGATREDLLRAVCTPATDINDFEQALMALQRYGSYFHAREGLYFFDREENADAKVEFRSLTIDPQGARSAELIKKIWCEDVFREPQSSVVFTDPDQTKTGLDGLGTGRLRFVLSPRRLSNDLRHLLYFGVSERNQVILLEPRDAKFDALSNRDLIKWAQRVLAASELASTPEASRRADYERIAATERKYILETLRRAGLVYIRIERYGAGPSDDSFEEESLGNALNKEDVVTKLSQDLYPTRQVAEHLLARLISTFLDGDQRQAIVVFDGLSLREMPALQSLALASRLGIIESGVGRSALPSETVDFIEQQLGFASAPSQLPGRRELKDRGCAAYYYSHPGERHSLDTEARALLLWSSFPDNTYRDSGARFSDHFAQIQTLMESAWNSTVMTIPRGRRILVTSDHGYLFLGSGLSFSRHRDDLKPLNSYLGGERFARISERGAPPVHDDLAVYRERDLVMLKGRIQLHLQGPNANKLYKHGGLSLMEMLTPWLVLSG